MHSSSYRPRPSVTGTPQQQSSQTPIATPIVTAKLPTEVPVPQSHLSKPITSQKMKSQPDNRRKAATSLGRHSAKTSEGRSSARDSNKRTSAKLAQLIDDLSDAIESGVDSSGDVISISSGGDSLEEVYSQPRNKRKGKTGSTSDHSPMPTDTELEEEAPSAARITRTKQRNQSFKEASKLYSAPDSEAEAEAATHPEPTSPAKGSQ